MNELDIFCSVDFDWTRQLKSVWRDPPYHVPSLHQDRLDDIIGYFKQKTRDPDPENEPLGRVIVGPAGYGKTHLIGELRRRVWEMDGWFILLDFVGVKDFWSSVALGFLSSLQVRMPAGRTQCDRLVLRFASQLGIDQELVDLANRWQGQPRKLLAERAGLFIKSLSCKHFQETGEHRNVIIALILLVSEDLDCHSVAHAWLQGMNLESDVVGPLGFLGTNSPVKVVQSLAWIMSLVGPSLIAVDQFDTIVSASNTLTRATNSAATEELEEAKSIVESLALGLMDLHEKKRRAVTVVSCLEITWKVVEEKATVAVTDRYKNPAILYAVPSGDIAARLVAARLSQTYAASDFKPPYPTWPFPQAAFTTASGFSPRQLLKACELHRQFCADKGKVTECKTFAHVDKEGESERTEEGLGSFDQRFKEEKQAASVAGLMDADGEDRLRELLDASLRLFEKHLDLPDDIDVVVQRDPDQRRPSLHARLSFTFHDKGDREQHYCFRILGHTHATAFQSRLRAAMTASGIDTALRFRHLFILRRGDPPGGPRTKVLVDQFLNAGGKFIEPTDDDLRAFVAMRAMAQQDSPGFDNWLRTKKPLYEASIFQEAGLCPPPFLSSPSPSPAGGTREVETGLRELDPLVKAERELANNRAEVAAGRGIGAEQKDNAPAAKTAVARATEQPGAPRLIPIGRRFEHGTLGEAVTLGAELLPRHMAILAGSGSGKTVLLRRIVEETALLGIPSIVLDINNDLATLGDRWPARPDSISEDDVAEAAAYHNRTGVVIWTPGVSSGNPISLNLLPDFAAVQTEDERAQVVEMARATLAPYLGGAGQKAALKQGVLADALRVFANGGGSALDDLIALLSDLPDNVSRIGDAPKLAREIADRLCAAIATNPLLRSGGPSLDPKRLFHGPDGKTRISVINLAGLGSDEAQQSFVNQLQMALFTWIKQNPSSTGRLYVLDEAQNFAPSQMGTACKGSTLSLVAQARKYGLGMIFATQLPKGIDNKIVSNCTTHFYGRMSSPATIQATQELMAAKGGAAEDIGRLTKGEFYFSTDGFRRPINIRAPLCLSWHPPNPPTADEVIQKARVRPV